MKIGKNSIANIHFGRMKILQIWIGIIQIWIIIIQIWIIIIHIWIGIVQICIAGTPIEYNIAETAPEENISLEENNIAIIHFMICLEKKIRMKILQICMEIIQIIIKIIQENIVSEAGGIIGKIQLCITKAKEQEEKGFGKNQLCITKKNEKRKLKKKKI